MERLLVISHVRHYQDKGRLFAYGPYAREIDIWADLFGEVVIAAPLRQQQPPADAIAFSRSNASLAPQLETGGDDAPSKALQFLALPFHIWRLAWAMRQADAIQVRCPGNLGLLGCLLAPLWRKPRVAKYAGQWNDYDGEPWAYRWQKRLLRSSWWGAPVLVYGEWPDQPSHVVPFFTSIMDEAQMDRARAVELRDWTIRPLEVLFVGRLSEAKNVDVILRAIAETRLEYSRSLGRSLVPATPDALASPSPFWEERAGKRRPSFLDCQGGKAGEQSVRLRIVGDGPMRGSLEALARDLGIGDAVAFEGAVPQAKVLDFYEQAHVLVLASQTEGWPKAIAEAMAFGLVCIGSDRGLVPQMLGDGRGLLVEPRDVQALTGALHSVLCNPNRAEEMSKRAAAWSQQFTLERFGDALREVLGSAWKVKLGTTPGEDRSARLSANCAKCR